MLETHLNGSKHLKKMKQLGQEDVSTGTIEGCGHFTIKWLTVIFDRLSGLISRIIREIKIFAAKTFFEVELVPVTLIYQQITVNHLFFQLSLRHDRFVFRVNWKKRNNNKTYLLRQHVRGFILIVKFRV